MEKEIITEEAEENEDINPLLEGIPVEVENKEPWRKTRYSCSGSGRLGGNFDLKHLTIVVRD